MKSIEPSPFEVRLLLASAGLFVVVTSCSQPAPYPQPESLPLARGVETLQAPSAPSSLEGSVPGVKEEEEGVLTLRQALSLALVNNATLSTFSWELRASEARVLQAGLLPNPEFEGEVEDFGGSGIFSGFDEAESTLALSQLVELGGKRRSRLRLAQSRQGLAAWDYEAKRLWVVTETAQAFVEVLAGQERVRLRTASLELARTVLRTVSERVGVGKSSPIEETRAQVVVSQTEIALERATRSLAAARARLASMWGSHTARFESVTGTLDEISEIPTLETLMGWIDRNPDVARWAVEIAEREARAELAEARAIPDVTVKGGARLLQGSEETAFVVGISLPLPLFDRNQGGRREAEFNLAKATEERREAEVRVRMALSDAYQALLSAFREVATLRDRVLPGARSAFEAIDESYRQGKLTQLDVLDAQRTLFEVSEQYTEALSAYHLARTRVEGLIGQRVVGSDAEGVQ